MIKNAGEKLLTIQRILRLQRQNEKLSMEVAQLRGELVPVEEFKADVIQCNRAVRSSLLGLPARLTPQLHAAQTQAEVYDLLNQAIYEALRDLSNPGGEEEADG